MVVDGVQVVLVAGGGGDGEVDELQADHVMTHKRIASLEVIVSAADAAPASVQFPTPKTRSRIQSPPRRLDQPDAGLQSGGSRQMVGWSPYVVSVPVSRRRLAIEKG